MRDQLLEGQQKREGQRGQQGLLWQVAAYHFLGVPGQVGCPQERVDSSASHPGQGCSRDDGHSPVWISEGAVLLLLVPTPLSLTLQRTGT